MAIPLACPKCNHLLEQGDQKLRCPVCHAEWPVVADIPRFISEPYYWGEIPQTLMQQVNQQARKTNWRTALNTYVADSYPDIYQYVINHNRADFSFFTPLKPDSVALDVGSGWGTISCLLAARYGTVVSVESVPERIEFLKVRAQQEGLTNIQPLQATFLELPIPESSLDLVVMNGVLEWIGIASESDTPDGLQRSVLRKLFACLKPGGTLYIGIENRLAYNYFFGAKDHSDLPFTSLVPRWMADWIMHGKAQQSRRTMRSRGAYRTYTYSYWGYQRILQKTGYSNIRIYIVLPDYNNPAYIIPTDNPQAFTYTIHQLYSGVSLKRQLIQAFASQFAFLGLQRAFAPCFGIFASKDVA
jgi:ubiquinone/menaquinone biosynthesis C-methylase UbiE